MSFHICICLFLVCIFQYMLQWIFAFDNLFWYMRHLFISCYVRFYCLVALFCLRGVLKMISRGISLEDAKREIKTIKKQYELDTFETKERGKFKKQTQQEQEAQERRQELGRNFDAKRSKQPGPQSWKTNTTRPGDAGSSPKTSLRKQPPQNHRCLFFFWSTPFIH